VRPERIDPENCRPASTGALLLAVEPWAAFRNRAAGDVPMLVVSERREMTGHPKRRRVPLPPVGGSYPRVGKIRLGEKVPAKTRSGESIMRPSAIDHFRVDPEDGITAPEAAASFYEVYGERPQRIRCQLPGRHPEDVFEGAWRMYGARKLKRRCDGVECDERTATGGWETKPCVCGDKRGTNPKHFCELTYTLNVFLPDVAGVGVWQIDTGSEISIDRVNRWLQMMHALTGDLLLLDFTLALVPQDVTPDGKTKTVYVLQPQTVSTTPAALMAGESRAALPEPSAPGEGASLPPPADDEEDDGAVGGEVVDESEAPAGPPPKGSEEDALWRERLGELRALGLTDQEIAKAASTVREGVNAWDLADDALFNEVMGACWQAANAKKKGARKEADDPPPAPVPEGQGVL
jgi:hypothetical protein